MKKALLYGGGVAALLLAYWWGRRSRTRELGGTGSSILDYAVYTPRLAMLAGKQIARATAGQWLQDYRKTEDMEKFWQAPAANAQAYHAAAYWMAVAARLLKSRSLAARAYVLNAKGVAVYNLPFSSQLTGSVASIMASVRSEIKRAAGANRRVAAILAALGEHSKPEAIAASQQAAADKGVVEGTIKKSVEDVASTAQGALEWLAGPASLVRAFLGMVDPKTGAPPLWFVKWGLRAGVGIAVGFGVKWYLGVRFGGQKLVVVHAPAPKQIEQAA